MKNPLMKVVIGKKNTGIRSQFHDYKKLGEDYEENQEKFTALGKHPKDLSLREFVVNFTTKCT